MRSILRFAFIIGLPVLAHAQTRQIGSINIYGQHTVSKEDVLRKLQLKEGDSLLKIDKKLLQQKLETLPGVLQSHVAAVCCSQQGKWLIYIGLSENKERATYKLAPVEAVSLPADGRKLYDEFGTVLEQAVRSGDASENDSAGYAWLNYPPAQPVQKKMLLYARQYTPQLRQVLLRSKDPEQRAAAAWIIAYGTNKIDIANDLIHAVNDPDEEVRNNAARALGILASYVNDHPDAGLHIPAEPFIDMINSIVWTDRNKGTLVLLGLTAKRPPYLLQLLKDKALLSLMQMARWQDPGHSVLAYIILARLASVPEDQIFPTFYSDKKNSSIDMMMAVIKAKQN